MCPSAPRVCSEPGGQRPVLSLSLDLIHRWITSEFPAQRPVTRSFGFFFDLRLNKRLSKQSWDCWFEMPPRSLWRHCNAAISCIYMLVTINLRFRIITQLDCIYVDYKYRSMSTCSHVNARASKLREATSIRHVSFRQDVDPTCRISRIPFH